MWLAAALALLTVAVGNSQTRPKPSWKLAELVYRASGVGIVVALVAGWLIRGWAAGSYTRVPNF